jgi:hypothetical protein
VHIISKIVCQNSPDDILSKVVPIAETLLRLRLDTSNLRAIYLPSMAHMARVINSRTAIIPSYISSFLGYKLGLWIVEVDFIAERLDCIYL